MLTHRFVLYVFPQPGNSNREKNLKPKSVITYTKHLLQLGKYLQTIRTLLQARRRSVPKVCRDLAVTVPFVLAMENTIKQWHQMYRK